MIFLLLFVIGTLILFAPGRKCDKDIGVCVCNDSECEARNS
jgi:hypothetical protein